MTRALRLAKPTAVLLISDLEPETFASRIPRVMPERTAVDLRLSSPAFLELNEAAVASVLRAAGVDLEATRADTTPVFRELPALRARLELKDSVLASLTAPNTVGILEGSDPALKREYLVFSAHMDHIGVTPGQPDSVNNGADDDASGTTGVIELAEAFSRPGGRPRRSIIFLTVSGEEKGLWGSRYFSEHPPVPVDRIVADINIDMIGRNWPDTIVAIGKEHSDLGATLERVNRAHPELGMTAIDDQLARGALLLPFGSLQFRPEGRPHPVLLQRGPPRLPPALRLARQDRHREGVAHPPPAVLSGAGGRRCRRAAQVESGELPLHRGRSGRPMT